MVLKPNMVDLGKESHKPASAAESPKRTLRCLRRHVPPAVPGIAFLSGGQAKRRRTQHLSLMNQVSGLPWASTFSYGRALQESALKAWGGRAENLGAGQKAILHRRASERPRPARHVHGLARAAWSPRATEVTQRDDSGGGGAFRCGHDPSPA